VNVLKAEMDSLPGELKWANAKQKGILLRADVDEWWGGTMLKPDGRGPTKRMGTITIAPTAGLSTADRCNLTKYAAGLCNKVVAAFRRLPLWLQHNMAASNTSKRANKKARISTR
tara:strand:+ start:127 stop:471 length:345 start_codon:yes stop_codon:yes gene_type:complete